MEREQLLQRAEEALEDAQAIHARLSDKGDGCNHAISAANHLSVVYTLQGRIDEAEALSRRVVTTSTDVHGETAVITANSLNNLALVLKRAAVPLDVDDSKRQVLLDEAVVCYSRALDAKSEELGREHPDTIVTMHNLAEALLAAGREEAGTAVQQGIIDVLKPDDTQEDTDRQRQGDDLRARERTIRDMLTRNPSSRDA